MSDGCSSFELSDSLCVVLNPSAETLDGILPFIGSGVRAAPAANGTESALLPFPERRASFEIYRADEVRLTSVLLSGGDWRWQFRSAHGEVLATGAGYQSEAGCRVAVNALHDGASTARIFRAN